MRPCVLQLFLQISLLLLPFLNASLLCFRLVHLDFEIFVELCQSIGGLLRAGLSDSGLETVDPADELVAHRAPYIRTEDALESFLGFFVGLFSFGEVGLQVFKALVLLILLKSSVSTVLILLFAVLVHEVVCARAAARCIPTIRRQSVPVTLLFR